ncbi:MAG: hypothetical protein M5U05_12495 [Anaerolineales bacterium]|jgi:hypothetical protein|nr:hypothetical protein [Anaerolineales bacterium]
MLQRKLSLFLPVIALLLAALACNLPGSASPTAKPIPAGRLIPAETQIAAAIQTAQSGGRVTLELTENQLTALANKELPAQGETQVSNARIRLAGGVMEFTGEVQQNGLSLPLAVTVQVSADTQGRAHARAVAGKLGPFALPQSQLDQLSSQFDALLQAQLAAYAGNLFVERISIGEGLLTITAQLR